MFIKIDDDLRRRWFAAVDEIRDEVEREYARACAVVLFGDPSAKQPDGVIHASKEIE